MAASVGVLFPSTGESAVDTGVILAELSSVAGGPLSAGDDRVREFLGTVSRRLFESERLRQHPEIGSLAFFLRRAELARAIDHLRATGPSAVRVPRGLVIHFAPANVATIFAYSWAASAIAGNRNIVRVSERLGPAGTAVLDVMNEALAESDPIIRATQRVVSYEHEDSITTDLCAACDVRVIWGGDATVQAIRQFPIRPSARDVIFPDRSSAAVISVAAWEAADGPIRRAIVESFATDTYWFDQAACSSPRNLVWVGDTFKAAEARQRFLTLLVDVLAERHWGVDASMAVEKRVATYALAARGDATSVEFLGNAVASVDLTGIDAWQRDWLGAGTICHLSVGQLEDIGRVISRKDQTLTQFGFTQEQLREFVSGLGGRGVDRVVPFGEALTFSRVWDGLDLVDEFSKVVTIRA